MLSNAPCKNCQYRTVGCHCVCKWYADSVEANEKAKAKERAESTILSIFKNGRDRQQNRDIRWVRDTRNWR